MDGKALDLAMNVPGKRRHTLERYGLALALAGLVLFLRGVLPFPEGTAIYQLPLAAVVLSAWYGGRGPGLLASLICITGVGYWFVPPVNSLAIAPDHVLPFSIFIGLCLLLSEFSAGRRRTEHALRASDERFRTLVQFSFDVYWETDAQHRFTRQEFSDRLTDAPAPGSEIGKTRWEVPYVEPDEDAWRRHRAMLDAHLPFRDFELARPTADGGTRYVSVSGIPVFDESGRFVGYRGVGRHITERKRAEAEHRAHVWFLESMDRINRTMQATNDLERMMSDVLEAVLEIFACDRAWLVYPCDPRRRLVARRHGAHAAGVSRARFALQARPALPRTCRRGARRARFAAARRRPGAERRGARPRWQSASVSAREMAHGAASEGRRSRTCSGSTSARAPRTWTADEQRLFEEIGHRLADALSSLIAFRSLRESERRLEAAQRVARVGWWERDYATGHVSLSDEACRIFGVQPVDLPHWHGRWLNLIHPEDRSRAAAASEAALGGGPRYDVEYRVVRPDGTVRVVHSQGDVIRDEADRPVRQFGVMQDITELRRAEKDLRASETRFRTFVDRATDAFFLLDEQLTVVDVNRQACESLGWSREELIGMHPRDFDAALDEPSIARIAERAGAGETITFDTRHRRKDGTVFPVEIRTGMFQQGGRRFYLALARDITERKRAEAELRARQEMLDLAQTAARAVAFDWYIGARESENRWSPELEAMYGLEPGTFDGTYEGWQKLVHPDDWPAVKLAIKRAHESGDVAAEYRVIHKDGTVHWLRAKGRMFFDAEGRPERMVGFMFDVTDWRHAEETLREKDHALQIARTELAHVSRLTTLGELTTSIAHEVSQPLGAMMASAAAGARWLAAVPPDIGEARAALDNIAADGKLAREVIARIRALTKRQVPRTEALDINQKILQVLALTEHELRSHDIVLRTQLDSTLPRVAGDRVQLQQVLLNLIVNAVEAMSAVHDRPRQLTIVSGHDGANAVLVEVLDSGIGLDPARAERVFEAFYTTKAEGIGIGLSISRSIVEAHGGRLWASANEPHGAVFRFSVPPFLLNS